MVLSVGLVFVYHPVQQVNDVKQSQIPLQQQSALQISSTVGGCKVPHMFVSLVLPTHSVLRSPLMLQAKNVSPLQRILTMRSALSLDVRYKL